MEKLGSAVVVLLGGFVLGAAFMLVASSAMFKNRDLELRLDIARTNGRFDVLQTNCAKSVQQFLVKPEEKKEEKKQ